jgi:predicted nucleic acid-binding protein
MRLFPSERALVSKPRYILDTGPLVAYANRKDQHHGWAVSVLDALGEAPLTCDIVLAEACWLLRSSKDAVDQILALVESGTVEIQPVLTTNIVSVREYMGKYWPQMDIADACVVALASANPSARVITTDYKDFCVYRLPKNRLIPLIVPSIAR